MRRRSQRWLLEEVAVRETGVVSQNTLAPEQAGSRDVFEQRSRNQVTNDYVFLYSNQLFVSGIILYEMNAVTVHLHNMAFEEQEIR